MTKNFLIEKLKNESIFEYYIKDKPLASGIDLVKTKRPVDKKWLQDNLLTKYKKGHLKFHDTKARQLILDFISNGKVI